MSEIRGFLSIDSHYNYWPPDKQLNYLWPITVYILYVAYFRARVYATRMPQRANYDPASKEATTEEIQSNPKLALIAAAKKYGIPRTSLQFK